MDRAGHNPESANNGFHEYTLRFLSSIRCLIGQPNFSIKEERNPYTGIRTETPRTELIFAYTPFRDAKLTGATSFARSFGAEGLNTAGASAQPQP